MTRILREDLPLLVLRLAGLGLALAHGWGKALALASGEVRFVEGVARLGFPMPAVFAWASALAEFLGGLLVALGLFTRVAAVFAAFNMAVAAFVRHHAHEQLLVSLGLLQVPAETLKAWGDPEKALLYLLAFLVLALTGPGRIAVESVVGRRRP